MMYSTWIIDWFSCLNRLVTTLCWLASSCCWAASSCWEWTETRFRLHISHSCARCACGSFAAVSRWLSEPCSPKCGASTASRPNPKRMPTRSKTIVPNQRLECRYFADLWPCPPGRELKQTFDANDRWTGFWLVWYPSTYSSCPRGSSSIHSTANWILFNWKTRPTQIRTSKLGPAWNTATANIKTFGWAWFMATRGSC